MDVLTIYNQQEVCKTQKNICSKKYLKPKNMNVFTIYNQKEVYKTKTNGCINHL